MVPKWVPIISFVSTKEHHMRWGYELTYPGLISERKVGFEVASYAHGGV